jgi:hypothetical protein
MCSVETYSSKSDLLLDSDFRFNYGALLWAYYPEYKGLRQFLSLSEREKRDFFDISGEFR